MSRTSTITIRGQVVRRGDYNPLFEYIKQQGGSVEIEGCVQGTALDEDGMNFAAVPTNGSHPFDLARQLVNSGQLSTVDFCLEIEGKLRYFNFDLHYDDRFVITINANRYTLEDGTTDFSWYYDKLVSKIKNIIECVESIDFCDYL